MPVLDHIQRPVEVFDVTNKKHREHYSNFLKNKTWGRCPVKFKIAGNDGSDTNMAFAMQRMLTEYYMQKEFK